MARSTSAARNASARPTTGVGVSGGLTSSSACAGIEEHPMEWALTGAVGVLIGTLIGSLRGGYSQRDVVLRMAAAALGVGVAVVVTAVVVALVA